MTTIAVDTKGTIAADGLGCNDNIRATHSARKIIVEDGAIYALAGTECLMRPLINWVKEGADPDKLPKVGDNAWGLLVITRTGAAHYHCKCPFPETVDLPWATGSGREIAIGLLRDGKTARRAVEIACELDVYSGGDIQVIDIAEALGLKEPLIAAE